MIWKRLKDINVEDNCFVCSGVWLGLIGHCIRIHYPSTLEYLRLHFRVNTSTSRLHAQFAQKKGHLEIEARSSLFTSYFSLQSCMSTRRKRIPSALDALMPYLKAAYVEVRRASRPAERLKHPPGFGIQSANPSQLWTVLAVGK